MTRLLVSVRNAAEARIALAAGAAVIDVKEPSRGALAAADPDVIAAVVAEVAGRVPVSAALGELTDDPPIEALLAPGLAFAKLGLAGCADDSAWPDRWQVALRRFPSAVAAVGVVYADWEQAHAPNPGKVLGHARRLGCRALLIDTFDKRAGGLFDCAKVGELEVFTAAVRAEGLLCVLGGSLTKDTIPAAVALEPDYIAVRGAACRGPRDGPIDEERVRDLIDLLSAAVDA